jgi:ABC-2 type transport system permease protein
VLNLTGGNELGIGYAEYPRSVLPLLSLYVAGQAPALVSRDLRFRVVTLYFSRPLRREDYVRAKLAALTTALAVLTCLPLLVLYASALLAELPFWEQTRQAAVGLLGCLVLSVLLAGIALVVAAVTPRRGLGVAAVITVLVMLSAVQGILQVLGQEQGRPGLEHWSGLLSPFTLVAGLQRWLFDAPVDGTPEPPGSLGGWVYLAVTLAVVAGTYGLLALRYRRVSVS